MISPRWKDRLRRLGWPPWFFTAVGAAALVIQFAPGWRETLIYHRAGVAGGEWWRIWTGHLVHFGWPHFIADVGLLMILGWTLGKQFRTASWLALTVQPLFITAIIYWMDPLMTRYAGLSAVNLGLLLLLAIRGWQGNWRDWFWPAIIVIYVAELIQEIVRGGQGGGFIQFDDPTVKVATSAHLAAAAYALLAWGLARLIERKRRVAPAAAPSAGAAEPLRSKD